MRRLTVPLIAIALAAAPAVLHAQTYPSGQGPLGCGFAGQPAAGVLALRAELGLTMDQVRGLQQIQAQQDARNAPLLEQLEAAGFDFVPGRGRGVGPGSGAGMGPGMGLGMGFGMGPGRGVQRPAPRGGLTPEQRIEMEQLMAQRMAQRDALLPVVEQLRESNQQACTEVRNVLGAEQLARLRELQPRRGPGAAGSGMMRRWGAPGVRT
jgi:hypothetical protein